MKSFSKLSTQPLSLASDSGWGRFFEDNSTLLQIDHDTRLASKLFSASSLLFFPCCPSFPHSFPRLSSCTLNIYSYLCPCRRLYPDISFFQMPTQYPQAGSSPSECGVGKISYQVLCCHMINQYCHCTLRHMLHDQSHVTAHQSICHCTLRHMSHDQSHVIAHLGTCHMINQYVLRHMSHDQSHVTAHLGTCMSLQNSGACHMINHMSHDQSHVTAHSGTDSLRRRVERSSLPSQKVGTARNGIKNVSLKLC